MKRTVAFEFDGETKYLLLHDREYTDLELNAEALRAIYWQVMLKHKREKTEKSEAECLKEAQAIPYMLVEAATLPPDRTFRAALRAREGKFVIDLDHARKIQMDRIRAARNIKLAELDVETVKAVGKGDAAARDSVEAQKQELRDIPQAFDLSQATTPEELKALWPEQLKNSK